MPAPGALRLLLVTLALVLGAANAFAAPGVYSGTSPSNAPLRQALGIPAGANADLMQWRLTLDKDRTYALRVAYGAPQAGQPGLGADAKAVDLKGAWTADAEAIALCGDLALARIGDDLLHVLAPDRSLMVGDGGQSYTLNREASAEKHVDPALAATVPDMSYPIGALATGPTVFAVFEGRTPCRGIAQEQNVSVDKGCFKLKWRLTLFQEASTKAPAAYKIEGGLYRSGAREGTWTITRGAQGDANAVVYRLAPAASAPELLLLKGGDDVLFFLDQTRKPRVGHNEFSYTLNRRTTP